jgi:hypothetical protein
VCAKKVTQAWCQWKRVQVKQRNKKSRWRKISAFPFPSSRDDAQQLRVIEHYNRVVQFARDLLRSLQRDETAENKALTPRVSRV